MLARLDALLSGLPRRWVVLLAAVAVAGVGAADYYTGFELSLAVFYLAPVSIAAWYAGRRAGLLIAMLCSGAWLAADIGAGSAYSHPAIAIWNAVVYLAVFGVTSALLGMLRVRLSSERILARTDPRTGVLNARAFTEQLAYSLALAQREGTPLTLAYVDLDDFKQINDRYGHTQGDRVLEAVGRTLGEATRRTDIVARVGGDEFALILPDTDRAGAESLILKFRDRLRGALAGLQCAATCSIGAVTFRHAPPDLTQAIDTADRLLYQVKRQGKDAVAFAVVPPDEAATGHGTAVRNNQPGER